MNEDGRQSESLRSGPGSGVGFEGNGDTRVLFGLSYEITETGLRRGKKIVR